MSSSILTGRAMARSLLPLGMVAASLLSGLLVHFLWPHQLLIHIPLHSTVEALGGLAETVERTADRWREAIAAARALPGKKLRVFSDLAAPVRARMQANQLSEPAARLLVERGVREVDGGYVWSSDPRLTLPTPQRLSEPQLARLVAGITCPTTVVYADPPQAYFPEPLRTQRAGLLPDGRLHVIAGTHHLHMEDPAAVAAVIGDFLRS